MINSFSKTRERNKDGTFIIPIISSDFNRKEYKKRYNHLHRKERSLKALKWSQENKERRKIIKKRWALKNKDRILFLKKQYIYRKKGAGGYTTYKQINALYEKYLNICAYCNLNKATSIDHIIPISRGGNNDIGNLLPACISCNSSKGSKLLKEWKPNLF